MNSDLCGKLLSAVTEEIKFKRKFEDHSTWTEAVSNNISIVVFEYNKDNPKLIRCKNFEEVNDTYTPERMEKFVGQVSCKYDEDYNMIHVWFSTSDNENHYIYCGCISCATLSKFYGVKTVKGWN